MKQSSEALSYKNRSKSKNIERDGSLEAVLFDSKFPRNCEIPICGHPAYKRDLDRKAWCDEHKDRGRF